MTEPVFVKRTVDDRRVEVIGGWVFLAGQPEASELTPVDEHPNRQAILKAVPGATHMAGRLPLTLPEASVAQAALHRANDRFDGSPRAVQQRLQRAAWQRAQMEGAD